MLKPLDLLQEHQNGLWQHVGSRRVYQVMLVANRDTTQPETFPETVIYQDIITQQIWSRPVEVFVRRCLPYHTRISDLPFKSPIEADDELST